jgi:hypothetical protein
MILVRHQAEHDERPHMRVSRPNPARSLALVAHCPQCTKDRRVVEIMGGKHAVLATCGHVVPRETAR